jgi:hypothetical protein
LLHAEVNPSGQAPGKLFNRVSDIDRVIREVRPKQEAWNCRSGFEFDDGRCNAAGLTETGRQLIRMMASSGAIIDVDHMSAKARAELLDSSGFLAGVYPLVSSHTGIQSINHGSKRNEGQLMDRHLNPMVRAGGAFAPILPPVAITADEDTYPLGAAVIPHGCGGTSESFVQAYRYLVEAPRRNPIHGRAGVRGSRNRDGFWRPRTRGCSPSLQRC